MSTDQQAVQDLVDILRVNTISALGPAGSYTTVCGLLREQCDHAGLSTEIIELVPGKPIVIGTWEGQDPSIPSLLLTGHYDVVPVVEQEWSCDPFGGVIRDGLIFGRGVQDMKSCLVAYIHCVRRLKKDGFVPKRNIHLLFVPDEEIGGRDGMQTFVESDRFCQLNVGFAIDEGLCSPNETVPVFFGERAVWWVRLVSSGDVGHASTFIGNSAIERLHKCLGRIYEFRRNQIEMYPISDFGGIIVINVTSINSGNESSLNVIPNKAVAALDIRIPATVDLTEFEEKLLQWTKLDNIKIEKIVTCKVNPVTSLENNPWWSCLQESCENINVSISPKVFPAATDSRFLRNLGIPCLGFSPFPFTPVKFHDHDEFISIKTFLNGISIYCSIVQALSAT